MRSLHLSRFARTTIAASNMMLLIGGSALAQSVPVFDDVPSIEQLRSIMIPESRPELSRSIVIQRPDSGPSPVQAISTQARPAVKVPATAAVRQEAPAVQTAASMPAQPVPVSAAEPHGEPGAVAFHINFAFNSTELPVEAHAMIDMMARLMKESPEVKIRVEGHTDAVGAVDYNISLSERRALSVAEYLVKQGVEPSRLILVGKGMSEPLTRNRFDPANRRVQFVRIA